MSFIDNLLQKPSYGWTDENDNLSIPSNRQLWFEAFSRMNIFKSKKNWISFASGLQESNSFPETHGGESEFLPAVSKMGFGYVTLLYTYNLGAKLVVLVHHIFSHRRTRTRVRSVYRSIAVVHFDPCL